MGGDRGRVEREWRGQGLIIPDPDSVGGIPIIGEPPGDHVGLVYEQGNFRWRPVGGPVMLGGLGIETIDGTWYPGEYIGLHTLQLSSSDFDKAAGYISSSAAENLLAQIVRIRNPPGSGYNVEIWAKEIGGTPTGTGITFELAATDPITFYNTQALELAFGDMIALRLDPSAPGPIAAGSLDWRARRIDRSS